MKKLRRIKKSKEVKDSTIIRIDRDKRLKKKKIKIRIAVILLLVAAICTIMLSPLFNIKEIMVEGNSKTKTDLVLSTSSIKTDTNIFQINIKKSKQYIKAIPYIDSAHIYRKLPDKVTISVTERIPVCYIKHGTGFILIDRQGRFLEILKDKPEKLPEITGLKIKSVKPGDSLGSEYSENLSALNELITEFKNLEIFERVSEINIKNPENLVFKFDGNKKIIMGENFRIDYKLMMLKATIEEIAPSEAGTIDLSKEGKALFTPDTK